MQTALLGADFLGHYGLLVDVANCRWLDIHSYQTTPFEVRADETNIHICKPVGQESAYAGIIEQFQEIFKPEPFQHNLPPKHGIFHHIRTTGPPVYSRFRRLSPNKLRAAKESFAEMERIGVCWRGSSPWASPLHMVPKDDGSWRPYVAAIIGD